MNTLLILFFSIVFGVWRAFAVSVMWGWFIVPLGFQDVSVAHCYGLCSLCAVVFYVNNKSDSVGVEDLALYALLPLVALLFSYIATLFM